MRELKTHCLRGHARTSDNVVQGQCRICRKLALRRPKPTHCRNGHERTVKTFRAGRCLTCKARAELNSKCKMRYGITYEERDRMIDEQGCRCAICRNLFSQDAAGRPEVDHCHTSEQVRGILCHACNVLLGAAKDNIETLKKAIDYLGKFC